MEYIIEVNGLNKTFPPKTKALKDFSLQVRRGITFGLLGPNGSGKTSLIRILVGILQADSGDVSVIDKTLSRQNLAGKIGYMSQISALYQDLTVKENLDFFAAVYGLKGKKKEERIKELISLVKLEGKENTVVATLSGGMKQRVSLISCLLHEPQLVFLDEPTVGIDPLLQNEFWQYFKSLNQKGTTIVMSTHVMEEANRCDEIALLREGQLMAKGSVEEILAETKTSSLEKAFLVLEGA